MRLAPIQLVREDGYGIVRMNRHGAEPQGPRAKRLEARAGLGIEADMLPQDENGVGPANLSNGTDVLSIRIEHEESCGTDLGKSLVEVTCSNRDTRPHAHEASFATLRVSLESFLNEHGEASFVRAQKLRRVPIDT